MITDKNFAAALVHMGFTLCGTVYEKSFPAFNCALQVDFEKRKLLYPDAMKGKDRNDTFDAPLKTLLLGFGRIFYPNPQKLIYKGCLNMKDTACRRCHRLQKKFPNQVSFSSKAVLSKISIIE